MHARAHTYTLQYNIIGLHAWGYDSCPAFLMSDAGEKIKSLHIETNGYTFFHTNYANKLHILFIIKRRHYAYYYAQTTPKIKNTRKVSIGPYHAKRLDNTKIMQRNTKELHISRKDYAKIRRPRENTQDK
jgi:hypothetical protein